ncbi:putative leucine-rich repeat domain superfamily [Helianthus annuus]|nr:putative leucine-rich repeat domain superfamily [Helianthus annuus]KAJ0696263.1 putative leucine-rich repeat domain superfamily [Helianthus annuus]KAJ0878863.1 putative leucine-rich repeat domain superfamily [Helianthus annuus]
MTSLQFLDLSSFPLGASNFANLLTMIPSLLELHLPYCNLKETHLSHILHNLTTFSNIQHIDLSHNRLTGSIPETIGRLAALTTFSVRHNKLSGTILVSIWQLSKLRSLDVSYNSLEGEIYESHLANLSMLKEFNVGSNSKLTLNVSREWLPPFQLRDIDLSSCKIGNGFPRWLRNQRKLHRLVLSNTTISGPLPIWLRKMPIIPFMDLSHNNLSGPLTNHFRTSAHRLKS